MPRSGAHCSPKLTSKEIEWKQYHAGTVVEDDKKIASFVVKGLKQNGFAVDHDADGETALIHLPQPLVRRGGSRYYLPKLDGLSLVRQLRDLALPHRSLFS